MNQTRSLVAMLALSLVVTACGGGGGSSSPSAPETSAPDLAPKPAPEPPKDLKAAISILNPAQDRMIVKDPVVVKLDGSNSKDDAGSALTYKWELLETPDQSLAKLNTSDAQQVEFTADQAGKYVASLIVNNGTADSASTRVTFTAISPKPIAGVEPTINVALGTTSVELDGSQSALPETASGVLEYQWTLKTKPVDSLATLANAKTSKPNLTVDLAGDYIAELVVTFDGETSEAKEVKVNVAEGNVQPVASAQDVEVLMGQKATVDASASTDFEGADLQYRWRISDAPFEPYPALNGATNAQADFVPTAAGEYELKLFVFDGQRASDELTVTVTAKADPAASENKAPVGELMATGYFPNRSVGEQELGRRAEFNFVGYDPEGETLQIVSAELIAKPAGSTVELVNIGSWKPLGKKIQKLDVVGTYRVRMTVSDGVNRVTQEATMEAKIGNVNNRPSTGSVDADSKAVLVGQPLIFESADAKDKDGDPITFEWSLIDKPNGSNATITPVTHPDEGDLRRAEVLTDVPGVYRVRLIAKDDRGLYSHYASEEFGYAKTVNHEPKIHSVVWARNWGRLAPGENYYQILPCMNLLHRPIVIDPDGDKVFTHNELVSVPSNGGQFTYYPDDADCPNARGQVFTKPGTYIFRYYATDIISDADNYDFVVKVDSFEDARGVRLKSVSSSGDLWHPLPYENIPTERIVFKPASKPIEAGSIQWALVAQDADYTIENVQVKHINGGLDSLTPSFDGLQDGTVIKKGETLNFKTQFPAIPCQRTDEGKEGFHLSFNIKEIPEISFVYENWYGSDNKSTSRWARCEAGELE